MSNLSKENLKGLKVEFHIIQSFPVTCLNRDDVGAPKTAIVGGVTRARVSSQCWKRQVRSKMHEFGSTLGIRTKKIAKPIIEECCKLGSTEENAIKCADNVVDLLGRDKKTNNLDTLLFITPNEIRKIATYWANKNFIPDDNDKKDVEKLIKSFSQQDCADVALFGRMVAKAPEVNISAASSFSHAISTHKVANDIDFFTAVDDIIDEDNAGSAHMGALEFNSATYYRYISVDVGQLYENLMEDNESFLNAIEIFTKALYLAVPAARQTTQAGFSAWDYGKILIRRGQNLQASFDIPVRMASCGGYSEKSMEALKLFLNTKEAQSGSLFGKLGECEIGIDAKTSIDDVVVFIKQHIGG